MHSAYPTPFAFLYDWFDWVAGVMIVGGLMLAAASVLGLIALALFVFIPWRRGGTPRCGHCGYPVRGVEHWTCPECGADYRQRGILAPHFSRRLHPLISIPLFTFFLITPAILLTIAAMALGPQVETHTDNVDIDPKIQTGFNQLQLYTYTAPGGSRQSPQRLELQIDAPNDWHTFEIDLAAMTYQDTWGMVGPASPTPLDRPALDNLFKSIGTTTTSAAYKQQADELWAIIQAAPTQGIRGIQPMHFNVVYNETWSESTPALWWAAVLAMGWVVLWLLGVVALVALYLLRRPTVVAGPTRTNSG